MRRWKGAQKSKRRSQQLLWRVAPVVGIHLPRKCVLMMMMDNIYCESHRCNKGTQWIQAITMQSFVSAHDDDRQCYKNDLRLLIEIQGKTHRTLSLLPEGQPIRIRCCPCKARFSFITLLHAPSFSEPSRVKLTTQTQWQLLLITIKLYFFETKQIHE